MTDVQAQIIIGLLAVITVLLLIIAVSTYVPDVLLKAFIRRPSDNVMSRRCTVTKPVEGLGKMGAARADIMPATSTGRKVAPSCTGKSAA